MMETITITDITVREAVVRTLRMYGPVRWGRLYYHVRWMTGAGAPIVRYWTHKMITEDELVLPHRGGLYTLRGDA